MLKMSGAGNPTNSTDTHLTCPSCKRDGVFHGFRGVSDLSWIELYTEDGKRKAHEYRAGLRVCPNSVCRCIVTIAEKNGVLIDTYPATRIPFNTDNIPENIRDTLDEAITCHSAKAYKAAAILVRRMLEELCNDKNAPGTVLHERLLALGKTIVVPQPLLDAAMELKVLGNDAAHIVSKYYDDIGDNEVSLAIDLAKELLKAVYQYDGLLARLQALKKT